MIAALRAHLQRRWGDLRPGHPQLGGALVVASDRHPSAKVTYLFFDTSGRPAAIAKVARERSGEGALVTEHDVLTRFWATGSACVAENAPEPLLLDRVAGRLVLVMSVRPGEPMTTRYYRPRHTSHPRRVRRDFEAAGSWLGRFQEGTMSSSVVLGPGAFTRWVEEVFDRYRSEIGWSAAEAELLSALERRAADLEGCRIPLVGVHGDYWMGNILLDAGGITGVIDWEEGRLPGLPFTDIYKFPTSYSFYLDRAYPVGTRRIPGHPEREALREGWSRFGDWPNLVGFAYAYFGRGWFPELVRQFVLGHLARLGIRTEANGLFFPVFLAQQAMTLRDSVFRNGYRALLQAFAEERDTTWLWTDAPGKRTHAGRAAMATAEPHGIADPTQIGA